MTNFNTAFNTAITPTLIKSSALGLVGSTIIGVLYAAATKGPILLTAGVCITASAVNVVVGLILLGLQKKQIISPSTMVFMLTLSTTLSCTAMIVTGIALGIFGPVAIGFLTVGTVINLSIGLGSALKTSMLQKQANASQQTQQTQQLQQARSQAQLLVQQRAAQAATQGLQDLINGQDQSIQGVQNNVAMVQAQSPMQKTLQAELQQLKSEMQQLQTQYAGIDLEDQANLQDLRSFQTKLISLKGKQDQQILNLKVRYPGEAARQVQSQPPAPPAPPAAQTPPTSPQPAILTPLALSAAAQAPSLDAYVAQYQARPSPVQTPPTSPAAAQTSTQSSIAPTSPTLSLLAKLEIQIDDAATHAEYVASIIPSSSKNAQPASQKAKMVRNAAKAIASRATKAQTATTSADRAKLHNEAISLASGAKRLTLELGPIAKEEAAKSALNARSYIESLSIGNDIL